MSTLDATGPDLDRERDRARRHAAVAGWLFASGFVVVGAAFATNTGKLVWLLVPIALAQAGFGIAAAVRAIRVYRRTHEGSGTIAVGITFGVLGLVGVPLFLLLGALATVGFAGGAWGRPLKMRGRSVHPRVRAGGEWARGDRPAVAGLDEVTRRALAVWWLQDAKKEHASVPAFARVAWQLAAHGAPAELLERAHRAALEEIDHARRCFALVAGYGGSELGVEPMPELDGGLDGGSTLATVAAETLVDGCLIEDLNADAAALAATRTTDRAVLGVVEIIARDERSHAELAWDILAWCLREGGAAVAGAVRAQLDALPLMDPIFYDETLGPLVARADAAQLRAHGRVPAEEWPALHQRRRALTIARVRQLLDAAPALAAA
jgi:hypothetical protein